MFFNDFGGNRLFNNFALKHMADPVSSQPRWGPHPPLLFHPPLAAPSSHPSGIDPGSYLHSDPCVISGA